MTDRHHQDQQKQLKTSSEDDEDDDKDKKEAPSPPPQEAVASGGKMGFTGDGQTTTATILSNSVDGMDGSCTVSATKILKSLGGNNVDDRSNVDATAHSSCSAVQGDATSSSDSSSPQFSPGVAATTSATATVGDSEMAIMSESMAHASLSTSATSEQRPEGAVVERSRRSNEPKASNVATPSLVIVPIAPAPNKPKAGEGKKTKKRSPPPLHPGQSSGRWTHGEHEAFLEGLKVFGREWKKVAKGIPSRSSAQVRSHAQKYFSKLTRDEQIMNQEGQASFEAAAAAASGSCASTTSSAVDTAAEAMAAAQYQPPEVQRNVERILANPEQAQRDVEDTLRALRERYQQLQQRLREHQAQNPRQVSPSHRIEEEKEEEGEPLPPQPENANRENEPRNGKRRRGDANGDDCSMSSSTLSSLGNEELIALSVLGATLPNGGGGTAQAPVAAAQGLGHARQRSNSSLDSSSTNKSSMSSSAKRKREDAG